jgi:hypothetical protein
MDEFRVLRKELRKELREETMPRHLISHAPVVNIPEQCIEKQSVPCLILSLSIIRYALDWISTAKETLQYVAEEEVEQSVAQAISKLSENAHLTCKSVVQGVEQMKVFEGHSYAFMFEKPGVASVNDITEMLLHAEDILHTQCGKISDEITGKEIEETLSPRSRKRRGRESDTQSDFISSEAQEITNQEAAQKPSSLPEEKP